jgi:DNA-binding PadR family transcriptional regulator
MDRIDKEILIGLLGTQRSMYSLEKSITGTNYATVYRHIKKMEKEGLISGVSGERKNGAKDERGTTKPKITSKGLAKLIVEGDLKKDELVRALKRELVKNYGDLPASFVSESHVDEVYVNIFEKIKHKINLKYFDETYFDKTLTISLIESVFEAMKTQSLEKNAEKKAKARERGKKYVSPIHIEVLRKMRDGFRKEQEKYTSYVKLVDELLDAMEKMLGEKNRGSRL